MNVLHKQMNDIEPVICHSFYSGDVCNDPDCNKIHLTEKKMIYDEFLKIHDVFYLEDLIKKDSSFEIKYESNTTEMEIEEAPKPIFCVICKMIIDPENAKYYSCCDVYTCNECHQKWPFKDCCPECGNQSENNEIDEDRKAEIYAQNKGYLEIQILKK